jgi:hypothetical protein
VNLPPGYHVEYGGAYAEQQQSFKELLMIFITSSSAGVRGDTVPVQTVQDSPAHFGGGGAGHWRQHAWLCS